MGSGIASRQSLPRQSRADKNAPDDVSTVVHERTRPQASAGHPTDLISPQPLSYDERRDRWLRDTGGLWLPEPENAEQQRI